MKATLASLPGVDEVTIDFEGRSAKCTVDVDAFVGEDALTALDAVQFPATMVKPAT